MKTLIGKLAMFVCILSVLLSACSSFDNLSFSDVKIGERFWHSRDGFCQKITEYYCLDINYRSITRLFKVPDELQNVFFGGDENHSAVYNLSSIIEGHYILGFYTDDFLILCEEKDNNSRIYLSFEFSTQNVEYYEEVRVVYETFGFNDEQWFRLCNTNDEIL